MSNNNDTLQLFILRENSEDDAITGLKVRHNNFVCVLDLNEDKLNELENVLNKNISNFKDLERGGWGLHYGGGTMISIVMNTKLGTTFGLMRFFLNEADGNKLINQLKEIKEGMKK